jgi:hypothetical protein
MPSRDALIVRTAEAPGDPGKPTEDRIFVTDNAVILLDGATDYESRRYSGGWIADQAGQRLRDGLIDDPGIDLQKLVESAIVDLVDTYDLIPGQTPSTTLALLRVHHEQIDVLVIADSPVIIKQHFGDVLEVRDHRLADITNRYPRPSGPPDRANPDWLRRYDSIESHRNRADGFWTISASPEAAGHAVSARIPAGEFAAALLMSDGVSALKDTYEPEGWASDFDRFTDEPAAAIARTIQLEAEDPNCQRWPRSKPHDDKAIASATLIDPHGSNLT